MTGTTHHMHAPRIAPQSAPARLLVAVSTLAIVMFMLTGVVWWDVRSDEIRHSRTTTEVSLALSNVAVLRKAETERAGAAAVTGLAPASDISSIRRSMDKDFVTLRTLSRGRVGRDAAADLRRIDREMDAIEDDIYAQLRDGDREGALKRMRTLRYTLLLTRYDANVSLMRKQIRTMFHDERDHIASDRRIAWITSLASMLVISIALAIGISSTRRWHRRSTASFADLTMTERRLRLILESTDDGILGLDEGGRVVFANRAAAGIAGVREEDLLGLHVHDVFHPRHAGAPSCTTASCEILRLTSECTPHRAETDLQRSDARTVPVEYVAAPAPDQLMGLCGVVTFRDISVRREVERVKEEILSIVSHEMRTPLTSLRGALGLLHGSKVRIDDERRDRLVAIAINDTDRLVRLINDMLDLERGSPTEIEPVRCSVAGLVEAATDCLQVFASGRGVSLLVEDVHGAVRADPDRVVQVLTNLVGNAVKFSPSGGLVTVGASQDTEAGTVCFHVRDEGPGVPEADRERIFERFVQVDSRDTRSHGGTGLGLAISRQIVEAHGGRIWVDGGEGSGSTFRFTLPLAGVESGQSGRGDDDEQSAADAGDSAGLGDDRPANAGGGPVASGPGAAVVRWRASQ